MLQKAILIFGCIAKSNTFVSETMHNKCKTNYEHLHNNEVEEERKADG